MLEKITNCKIKELILSETPERYGNLKCRKDSADEGFMIILALDNNDLITLNSLGRQVFEMCDGHTPIKQIVDTLYKDNDACSLDEMIEYTIFCIRDMQKKGILYRGNPAIIQEVGINT